MAALSLFLALVLALSSAYKLLKRERLATAAARLTGLPLSGGALASLSAAALEATSSLAIVLPETRAIGALIAAVLWLGYAALLAGHLGQSLDCGCSLASREKPVSLALVAKATGLAALALLVACVPAGPYSIVAPFAALGIFVLYLALDELLALPRPSRRTI